MALSFHGAGSHTSLLPPVYLIFHVQSPGCVDSTPHPLPPPYPPHPSTPPNPRRLYLISAYSSFSTVETSAKNFIISCLKYWTTSCLPASHCQGDFSKDTCQLYYCLVWNVSQFPTSFSIKPTLFRWHATHFIFHLLLIYLAKINVLQNSEKSVLSLFSENVGALPLELSPTPRRFLFTLWHWVWCLFSMLSSLTVFPHPTFPAILHGDCPLLLDSPKLRLSPWKDLILSEMDIVPCSSLCCIHLGMVLTHNRT